MKNTKIKISLVALSLMFMAASCNPFAAKPTGGIVKTTNGGADWQFVNSRVEADNKVGSISAARVGPLAIRQNNSRHVYAASYNGGVLYSENAGESWQQILSNVSMYDIALDPGNSDKVYASGSVGDRGKVLLTTDGGKSWQDIFNESTTQNPVRQIALDPNNADHLLIGLQSGNLIRSTDGGVNWQLVKSFDDRIQEIVWHKDGTIFVLLRRKGVQQSSDSITFTSATEPLTGEEAFNSFKEKIGTFVQLAVDTSASGRMYVTTDRGLFSTENKGQAWKKLSIPSKENTAIRGVALSDSSKNVVYVSAGPTIYKSADGGQTFQTHSVATTGFINYIVVDPRNPQAAFAGIVTE
jgi:photosystem II stability/assembly factor-like uncharacterized protein